MLKTAQGRLSPAVLLFALVGLAGCHVSFGSGSSSQSPGSRQSKPAHHTPSKAGKATKPTSKAINETDSKPTSDAKPAAPSDDKTTDDGPTRDQPASTDPKRTLPAEDPTRTEPADEPTRSPKYIGKNKPTDAGAAGEADDTDDAVDAGPAGGAGSSIGRPGSVTVKKAPQ